MAAIVQEATGDESLGLELMNSRTDLVNYDCYESAVKHYDTYCYDISKVRKTMLFRIKVRLHKPSKSPFLVPFKNGFSAVLWSFLHVMLKRSKVPLTKTATLMVHVNEPLPNGVDMFRPKTDSLKTKTILTHIHGKYN